MDDVVGDIFVRFYERAPRVREAECLRSYLMSIARNVVQDQIRKRTRRQRALCIVDSDVDEARATDDPAARAALLELGAILERMRLQDRRAYVLRRVMGLKLDRVAEELGVSRSTTQRRVNFAIEFVHRSAARNALLSEYTHPDYRDQG